MHDRIQSYERWDRHRDVQGRGWLGLSRSNRSLYRWQNQKPYKNVSDSCIQAQLSLGRELTEMPSVARRALMHPLSNALERELGESVKESRAP